MRQSNSGITAPKGFLASGMHCGIKYKNKDLALVYSQVPCVSAGVYTRNKVKAAPLKVTIKHLRDNRAQAILINSGNANCCTGKAGIADAEAMAKITAETLCIKKRDVLVASTGVIGKRMPIDKITSKAKYLVEHLSKAGHSDAADAILTTDTVKKEVTLKVKLGGREVTIGAMAKGAGMIAPNMATMLAFITTDLAVDGGRLVTALRKAVENSFNRITVEGDMSTNDMVLVLANGLAANKRLNTKDLGLFQEAMNKVCRILAMMIVKDGEGATKFVEILVKSAKENSQALKVAMKIANSPLVKTALYGENPNWGRIAACVGAADDNVVEEKLSIYLGRKKVFAKGRPLAVSVRKLEKIAKKKELSITVDLGLGAASEKVYTCDLTREYIKINAEY